MKYIRYTAILLALALAAGAVIGENASFAATAAAQKENVSKAEEETLQADALIEAFFFASNR